jgi:TRAP-type C4-dicarboxylate transport system permease small subunit
MDIVKRLLRWLEVPINILLWVGLLAGFAMVVHVCIDVTGRTFFSRPFMGTTEIVANWYMVAIAFLPWAWIEQRNNHIAAGMFEHIGGPRFDFWLGAVVKVCSLAFIALFTWQSWVAAVENTRAGEVTDAAGGLIQVWPSRWLLPVAGASMGLYMALRLVVDLAGPKPR